MISTLWKIMDGFVQSINRPFHRRALVVLTHVGLIALANYLAFWIRFEGKIPVYEWNLFLKTLPLVLAVQISCITFFGLNRGLWRYASIGDLMNIMKAVSLSTVILVMVIYFFLGVHKYPRSVYIVDWILLILFLGGVRLQWRIFRELSSEEAPGKRALLVGAGDAGELILREFKQNPSLPYQPVGFVDDDPRKKGLKIHGVPVLGGRENLASIVSVEQVEEIIITISSAPAKVMREVVADCNKTGLPLKIIPGYGHILGGRLSVSEIREVRIEDLLYRDIVKIDSGNIEKFLMNKTVLVTGAAGSIGSELCRQISKYRPGRIILFDQAESSLYFAQLDIERAFPHLPVTPIIGDLQDVERVSRVFEEWKPEVVFHSAAYKHVPLLEHHPSEAIRNNIVATRDLAAIANEHSVERFVLISTDKAVNPTSVMGATKRMAELYIQELAKVSPSRFVIVRFGNVLGSNGSVIPLFRKQIEERGPVTVTHPDVMRYFMTIAEAVQLVLQASVMGNGGEVFVLDMGEQVKIIDLARNMIALSGFEPDEEIKITFTGLRPGEKLYEELFDRSEEVEKTSHRKLMKAVPTEASDLQKLRYQIKQLEDFAANGQEQEIVVKLGEILPTYQAPITPSA